MARGRKRGSPFNCQLCFVLLVFYARHVQNDVALNVGPLPGLINGQQATGQWDNGPTGQQANSCNKRRASCHMPRTTCPSSVSIWRLKLLKAQPLTKRVALVIIAMRTCNRTRTHCLFSVARRMQKITMGEPKA